MWGSTTQLDNNLSLCCQTLRRHCNYKVTSIADLARFLKVLMGFQRVCGPEAGCCRRCRTRLPCLLGTPLVFQMSEAVAEALPSAQPTISAAGASGSSLPPPQAHPLADLAALAMELEPPPEPIQALATATDGVEPYRSSSVAFIRFLPGVVRRIVERSPGREALVRFVRYPTHQATGSSTGVR